MIRVNRRRLLNASGSLFKRFMLALIAISIAFIVLSLFGAEALVYVLINVITPTIIKMFILIICFLFVSVILESFS
jgi:hypothetical protein